MIKQIINAKLVLDSGIIEKGTIAFEDGIIKYIGNDVLDNAETTDANGKYVMAGFVDIHCHGGGGYDFMDASAEEMRKISAFHLKHGTTTLVATTMTDRYEAIFEALDRFAEMGDDRLTIHGVHLEGPWLSPAQCGAQDTSKMSKPSVEMLLEIISKYPFVERIDVAPEEPKGLEVGKKGVELGVVMGIAHSDADFDNAILAVENGYKVITHLYSGMKGVTRVNAYRIAGLVEAGLYDDRLICEVIADGKHLPIGLLKLIYKCKGTDGICLITDGMRGAGMPDGTETMLGRMNDGVPCIIDDGVAKLYDRQAFAGSVATADRLVRTMHFGAGIDIVSVSKMMSKTPALVMGYTDRGTLEVGKNADIVVLNNELEVQNVYLNGEKCK